MISSVFAVLFLTAAALFIFSIRYKDETESILTIFLSAFVFFYLSYSGYTGITESGTSYVSGALAILMVIFGLTAVLLAAGRVFEKITEFAGGIDGLSDRINERINR